MRKFLISAALLSSFAVAAPAAAQYRDSNRDYDRGYDRGYDRDYNGGYRSDDRIDHQIRQIEDRIRRAAANRQISGREANRLLRQADQIDRLEDRYSRNGLTQWEVRDLRNRVQNLRQQLRFERQDGNNRRW